MTAAGGGVGSGPTLVETVSIDYEDFNETYLTCATCLCVFDGVEHVPKLLPCSHTVCLQCLDRIVATFARDNGQFRCPICRELITIPRGGVASLPPSFLVNQLMDLMARQRRQVVPKCTSHQTQELLFCETCDVVFCTLCTGGSHRASPAASAAAAASATASVTATATGGSAAGLSGVSVAGLSLRSSTSTSMSAAKRSRSNAAATLSRIANRRSVLGGVAGSGGRLNSVADAAAATTNAAAIGVAASDVAPPPVDIEHTVIPFSVAIKRMTEIVVYKANECRTKLQRANETVSDEIRRLDANADETTAAVNACFAALAEQVEVKRQQVVEQVRSKREEKRQVLHEQLDIIQQERRKIDDDVKRSETQVEVRHITKTISDLNCKLDTLTTLCEPRENCFIEFNFAGESQRSLLAAAAAAAAMRQSSRSDGNDGSGSGGASVVAMGDPVGDDSVLRSVADESSADFIARMTSLLASTTLNSDGAAVVDEVAATDAAAASVVTTGDSVDDGQADVSLTKTSADAANAAMLSVTAVAAVSASADQPVAVKRKSACIVRTSKTFPSLCRAWLTTPAEMNNNCVGSLTQPPIVAKLVTVVRVSTYDYNGERQRDGGDPVHADLFLLTAEDADDLLRENTRLLMADGGDFQHHQHSTATARVAAVQPPSSSSTAPATVTPATDASDDLEAKMAARMRCVSAECQLSVIDRWDGTYDVVFTAQQPQIHCLRISLFDRPIKDCPLYFGVSEHNAQVAKMPSGSSHASVASGGSSSDVAHLTLRQPCAVGVVSQSSSSSLPSTRLWTLDTGHSRLVECDAATLTPIRVVDSVAGNGGLDGQSATGMSVHKSHLFIVNWRRRSITCFDVASGGNSDCDSVVSYTHSDLVEPIAVAVADSGDRLAVCDNGAAAVFIFNIVGSSSAAVTELKLDRRIDASLAGKLTDMSSVAWIAVSADSGSGDEIVVADARLHVFDATSGVAKRQMFSDATSLFDLQHQSLSASATGAKYGGVCYDASSGLLLATRIAAAVSGSSSTSRSATKRQSTSSASPAALSSSSTTPSQSAASVIQIFNYRTGDLYSIIDSHGARLRRPLHLATLPPSSTSSPPSATLTGTKDGCRYVVVADVGANCVRKYRFQ